MIVDITIIFRIPNLSHKIPPKYFPKNTPIVIVNKINGLFSNCVNGIKPINERITIHRHKSATMPQWVGFLLITFNLVGKCTFNAIKVIRHSAKILRNKSISANIVPKKSPTAPLDTKIPSGDILYFSEFKIKVPAPT